MNVSSAALTNLSKVQLDSPRCKPGFSWKCDSGHCGACCI